MSEAGKILIIDDSVTMRQQLSFVLETRGFTVLQAEDGEEGLQMYKANKGDLKLIICDVNMPKKNGLEVLETIRSDDKEQPFMMLTTEGQQETIEKGKSFGIQGWMVKPFKPDILVYAVNKIIEHFSQKTA